MAVITSNSITFIDNSGLEKYLYIRYSNDGVTFTENNGLTPGEWLGTCTTNSTFAPNDFSAYQWSKIRGEDGKNATTYYTWIKYADDANGANMSDDPTGKEYIGIAYNKETRQESDVESDYVWSLIKGANGINGVAGKGIKSITEYYITSSEKTGITRETSGWSTEIPTLDRVKKYLWNYEETIFVIEEFDASGNIVKREETDKSEPIIIGVYGESGSSLQIKYISSATTPIITNNNVDAWLDVMPAPIVGKKIYMIQKLSDEINWSTPIQISAEDGATPKISIVDGYWNINGESTGVKAEGENGDTPEITIGQNGNWFINGSDSGTKAQGEAGKDGSDIEYVYCLSDDRTPPATPEYDDSNKLTGNWHSSPLGVTEKMPYEFVSVRTKLSGHNQEWSVFSDPVIWSKWGEKGQDGDGVYYEYYLSDSSKIPQYSTDDSHWTDEPSGVSEDCPYEYVVQIRTTYVDGVPETHISMPALWAKYGEKGSTLQIKYINSKTTPVIVNNDVSAWSDNIPVAEDGENIYMTQKTSTDINWSSPIQISSMSAPTVEIINGYWYVDGDPTNIKAVGEDGKPPEIIIGKDGYWYIDGESTDIKAEGKNGKDGADIEYVYYRNNTGEAPEAPSYDKNTNKLTEGWHQSPVGIEINMRYEFVSIRTKPSGSDVWSDFSKPVIWSMWGEKGQDGDGVAYEYYICNEKDVGKIPAWSEGNTNWKDDPQGVSAEYPYEYVVQLTIKTENGIKTITASSPSLWAKYGDAGASLQIKYISSTSYPTITNNNVSEWANEVPPHRDGYRVYMTQKMSDETNWSAPIQISAADGETPSITIVGGYWYVNGESTNVKAEGTKGDTPKVTIGSNGNWYINGIDSGNKAQGESGKDGASIEYVYYRNKTAINLSTPSRVNGVLTSGWTDSPQGITEEYQYEYVSVRNKPLGGSWGNFSSPVIWSKWGEKGQDGDGVEYKYHRNNSSTKPDYPGTITWTDDPQGVTSTQQYEYVVQIKTVDGVTKISEVALWAKYGEDGNGIVSITNYYGVTSTMSRPSVWETSPPTTMADTDKYLWNYEEIVYTNGDSKTTDPAIIGIRGDNGTNGIDAVDFQIYSIDGFEFSEDVKSIRLQTVAIQGGNVIESGVTYQWKWWNKDSSAEDKYEDIQDATNSYLIVDASSRHAFADIKCQMKHDGILYEDHVSLREKTTIYSATVKFFDGNNVVGVNEQYIIAYVDLYKDNQLEDTIVTKTWYELINNSNLSNGIITNVSGNFEDGDIMYFVYQENGVYKIMPGTYSKEFSRWTLFDRQSKYVYENDVNDTVDNVFVIPKGKIPKSLNINIKVSKKNKDENGKDVYEIISMTNTTVMDLNDPIVGEAPLYPKDGQLWLDTKSNILKVWDGDKWVNSGYQNGGAVYTSQPSSYSKGDLWILDNGDILKATESSPVFNESHWIDATNGSSSIIKNVRESFNWDDSGIQIAKKVTDSNGKTTTPFYVHLDSTRMGFHSVNEKNEDSEVVHIGYNSAVVKNAAFVGNVSNPQEYEKYKDTDGARFDCNATFNQQINICKVDEKTDEPTSSFSWKVEQNGSLSLAIAT